MSSAVSPRSTIRSADLVHVPLLPLPSEEPETPAVDGDPRFHHAALAQRVLTAAGEVEAAEWMRDQVLEDVASDEEIGVGLDIGPVDGALETARWALDQAVSALHAEIRAAAERGVPLALLSEASALGVEELRLLLAAAPAVPAVASPVAALPAAV